MTVTDKNGEVMQSGEAELLGSPEVKASGNAADCHGTTFASGQVWINNDQVGSLIKGDAYSITTNPQPGDVGIYTQNGSLSTTDHSVSVLTTGAAAVQTVGSKGGITNYTVTTPGRGWSDANDKLTYYSQSPKKQ